jgi:hypothetical protein
MYHEGGPVDLKIRDLANPAELLDNANLFLESFRTQAEETVAKPYLFTLAPVAIARSQHRPLNAVDVEHAQDVLIACTKARSRILDKLNLLEFIRSNSDRFSFQPDLDARALAAIQGNYESDLDLVAQCASSAINSPSGAKMPADFAAQKGKTYPSGSLPSSMPIPLAGKMTKVPDLSKCTSWGQCIEMTAALGLVAEQIIAKNLEPSVFKVLSISPPADENVREGAVVKVTTQPAKVDPRKLWEVTVRPDLRISQVMAHL